MEDPHYQLFTCLKAALLRDRERDDSRGALPEDVEALLAKSLFESSFPIYFLPLSIIGEESVLSDQTWTESVE